MSKMDGLRAMREARYAEGTARAKAAAPTAKKPAAAKTTANKPPATKTAPAPGTADEGLCGHRAISGRTCTRDKGHAAKSHRYG
jgi:hypothetical protein